MVHILKVDQRGNRPGSFIWPVALVFVILLLGGCNSSPLSPATVVPATSSPSTPADGDGIPLSTATAIPSPVPTATPSPTPTPWPSMPFFGVEPHKLYDDQVMTLLVDSGASLVRYGGVSWDAVEAEEGVYNWDVLWRTDAVLEQLAARGIDVILIIRGAPLWAQKVYGHTCGPVSSDKLNAFAAFMYQLVQRYSQPPYNVRYWELGNEPDVDPSLVPADSVFGCWGDQNDPYYGGGYYAEMLRVVYPAIKAADPSAQVLNGGLLMDCDPTNPPEGKDCHPTTFLEGILRNGGGDYLDAINFHGYPPFVQGSLMMDRAFPSWDARGGVVVGKISYIRELMGRYGVDKPLFLTETSLICPEWNKQDCNPPGDAFFQAQADYVVRAFLRNWALGVQGTIWYDFEGKSWRYASMIGANLFDPDPAFYAFQFLNRKLADARMMGPVEDFPGIEGYAFVHSDNTQTWVLWSLDESPISVKIPSDARVLDKFGTQIALADDMLEISSPVYIDLP